MQREQTIAAMDTAQSQLQMAPLPLFELWLRTLSAIDNRLYFRDQSAESLQALVDLAQRHKPTIIIELGTLSGLSLRAWLLATREIPIHAVDLNFSPLAASSEYFPFDFSRVILHEQDILTLDFPSLWNDNDRVLLFIDAHDLPNTPIMEYIVRNAFPALPCGSMVVVDDLWHSEKRITQDTAQHFFETEQLARIDELQCFTGHYVPYHNGGSFLGFREATTLLDFVNTHNILLQFEPQGKSVWFEWDREKSIASTPRAYQGDAAEYGVIEYNPLHIKSSGPLTQRVLNAAGQLYKQGNLNGTIVLLDDLLKTEQRPEAYLALAVCLGRLGNLAQALDLAFAAERLDRTNLRAQRLCKDLSGRLGLEAFSKTGTQGVTIFAVPKAFTGHTAIIQKNALRSWAHLSPPPEIILFGDEPGTADMAREIGARHEPALTCNEFGTPLLDDLFHTAAHLAQNDVLAYVNADIMLFDDFMSAASLAQAVYEEFLLVGQRWDMVLLEEIDMDAPDWRQMLREEVSSEGFRHFETGIDYFVHTKGIWKGMPPFAIGRCAWDNWFVKNPMDTGKAVIDASEYITAVHQDHGYAHGGGRQAVFKGIEAKRNRAMAGNTLAFTTDAQLFMRPDGQIEQRSPLPTQYQCQQAIARRVRWTMRQAKKLLDQGHDELAVTKYEEAAAYYSNDARIAAQLDVARKAAAKHHVAAHATSPSDGNRG